jgi:hypothetical protein
MQPVMADFIRQSLLFPVIQSAHLMGLTIMVGTISLVDMRLLGIGLRRHTVTHLATNLAPWTILGVITVSITGPLMFWADMPRYLRNPAFVVKMGLLVLALAQHFTVHRNVTLRREDLPARKRRLAAALSLALWSAVVLVGRAIADFDVF